MDIVHIIQNIHIERLIQMILSVINQKGGVAKTTTAAAIGAGLHRRGYSVLYVDLDPQCSLTDITGADGSGLTVLDVLTRKATAKAAIQATPQGDIIAGSEGVAAEGLLTKTGKEFRLKEALEPVKALYQFIIVDCPPSLGILTINALTAATACIIPAQADRLSLQALQQFRETYDIIRRYTNPLLTVQGIVITRYSGRAILSREYAEMIAEAAQGLNTTLYNARIRESIAVKEAQAMQQDIFTYSPKSNATADYNSLIDEILERGTDNGKENI